LGQGGISVRRADQAGEVVREADVVSVIEALPPNERLRGSELMKDCRARVDELKTDPPTEARVNAEDASVAELYLNADPQEYTAGILCRRPDIVEQLRLSQKLLGMEPGDTPPPMAAQLMEGVNDSLPYEVLSFDFDALDCGVERICEVRGSVPITVLSESLSLYGLRARQVAVGAGSCEGKTGFMNERFIDF
ncbi:MAG: hypothetical protein AAGA32_16650, partial [Pseudomonadota bacterium]